MKVLTQYKEHNMGRRKGSVNFTEAEDNLIREYYPSGDYEELLKLLSPHPLSSIKKRASILQVKSNRSFTDEELLLLSQNIEHASKKELRILFPNRSYRTIYNKALSLGLNRKGMTCRKGSLRRFLDGSYLSYYWAGFAAADGCFMSKNNQFISTVSIKDREHLANLAEFTGAVLREITQMGLPHATVAVADRDYFEKVTTLFDFKDRKTYNPPSMSIFDNVSEQHKLAFFTGFIDGDGSIRSNKKGGCSIRIECHSSWLPVLAYCSALIYDITEVEDSSRGAYINNRGYATLTISKRKLLAVLHYKVKELNLPILERKWKNIIKTQ